MRILKGLLLVLIIVSIVGMISFAFTVHTSKKTSFNIDILLAGDSRLAKLNGLKEGLVNLGYRKNEFNFRVYNAENHLDRLDSLAQTVVNDRPDVVVTMGAIETKKLKYQLLHTNQHIPVVFAGIAAPKDIGIINDYKNPGGLFTGIDNYHMNLSGKRLEILHELVPSIKRVLIIFDSQLEVSRLSLNLVKTTSTKLHLPIEAFDIQSPNIITQMRNQLRKGDGLLILPSQKIEASASKVVAFTNQYKIPSMGIFDNDVNEGYLSAYGAPFFDQGYQSARYVSLILQGFSPAKLAVQLPDSIHFVINENTRKKIGVTLNSDLRRIADVVFSSKEQLGGVSR